MNRLRELYARSRRLPVRLRIAIVSAALTAIILIGFAAVVGRLVSNRLHDDFERDLQTRAQQLASTYGGQIAESGSLTDLNALTPVSDELVRISYADGTVYAPPNRSTLGPPDPEEIVGRNGLEIASAPIFITSSFDDGSADGRRSTSSSPAPRRPSTRRSAGSGSSSAAAWRSGRSSPASPGWPSPTGRCARSRR